ncbi:MAG: hypothetical protein ACBZ72_00435 [Candidatus Bathyarchaeia archaeon]
MTFFELPESPSGTLAAFSAGIVALASLKIVSKRKQSKPAKL